MVLFLLKPHGRVPPRALAWTLPVTYELPGAAPQSRALVGSRAAWVRAVNLGPLLWRDGDEGAQEALPHPCPGSTGQASPPAASLCQYLPLLPLRARPDVEVEAGQSAVCHLGSLCFADWT